MIQFRLGLAKSLYHFYLFCFLSFWTCTRQVQGRIQFWLGPTKSLYHSLFGLLFLGLVPTKYVYDSILTWTYQVFARFFDWFTMISWTWTHQVSTCMIQFWLGPTKSLYQYLFDSPKLLFNVFDLDPPSNCKLFNSDLDLPSLFTGLTHFLLNLDLLHGPP